MVHTERGHQTVKMCRLQQRKMQAVVPEHDGSIFAVHTGKRGNLWQLVSVLSLESSRFVCRGSALLAAAATPALQTAYTQAILRTEQQLLTQVTLINTVSPHKLFKQLAIHVCGRISCSFNIMHEVGSPEPPCGSLGQQTCCCNSLGAAQIQRTAFSPSLHTMYTAPLPQPYTLWMVPNLDLISYVQVCMLLA